MNNKILSCWLSVAIVPLMVACGGGSSSGGSTQSPILTPAPTPGALVFNPPLRAISLAAAQLQGSLLAGGASGQLVNQLATGGVPNAPLKCGVDVYKMQFQTVGGATTPEATQSSGALMIPTGPGCTGPRPIVLYAHGTTTDKGYDISNLVDTSNPANGESALIAAIFASNGFVVVAPNYAGYDTSTLGYHPWLNAAQQSHEMQDALAAARSALPTIGNTGDAGLLFVTGYSQGGHVAMTTVRDLEAKGIMVAGSSGMSGPYALEAFGDAVFAGNVPIGGTVFVPLLATSYQKEFGNLYTTPTEFYTAQFATGIESLLPSTSSIETLFTQGLLPQTALFDSAAPLPQNPGAASNGNFGFAATGFLINDTARAQFLQDASVHPDNALLPGSVNPLPAAAPASKVRQALRANDLRLPASGQSGPFWRPHSAMLLCAGGSDPTVFSLNTKIMQGYFTVAALSGVPGASPLVVNIDPGAASQAALSSSAGADTLFAALEAGFNQAYTTQQGSTAASAQAALISYHETVAPFCTAATAAFFKQLLPPV